MNLPPYIPMYANRALSRFGDESKVGQESLKILNSYQLTKVGIILREWSLMSRLNYESIGYNFKFPAQRVLQIMIDQTLLFPLSIDFMNYLLV